ncbi:MAG: PhnA domain-containing protein [Ruegeria sp.]
MSCALCNADAETSFFAVSGGPDGAGVEICESCCTQIEGDPDPNHMRCLATAMWSEDSATQVLAARLLKRLTDHDWARDLSDQLWLDEETQAWVDNETAASDHRDSNGAPLAQGDTVVLIKDLPVKGAGFTAKRGTAVRGISLVADNPEHIEGRVEGQRIVILTKFVKRK